MQGYRNPPCVASIFEETDIMERPTVDPEGRVRDLLNVGEDVIALQIDVDAVEVLVFHDCPMVRPNGRQVGVPIDDELVVGCRFRVSSNLQRGGRTPPGHTTVDG